MGDLYLFITVEIEKKPKNQIMTGKRAGFDFGLKTFLTCSNGDRIKSPEFFKKSSKEIKKANRKLSRKKKKSNRRVKARINLARVYKKLTNRRNHFFWKKAHDLTDKYDNIFLEDLCIKSMHKLWGRKISDLSFSKFVLILKHVADKKGKTIHFVDRFFPSSKKCCNCLFLIESLDLRERTWRCPNCKQKHDRDQNAAINILREGTSSLGLDIVRLGFPSRYRLNPESNVL